MGDAMDLEGGVCGGTWWNPPHNSFPSSLAPSCPVAQLKGYGFDMSNFGSKNKELIKETKINTNTFFDNLIFPSDQMGTSLDEGLDMLGFGLSPTSSTFDWNNLKNVVGNNEGNIYSLLEDNLDNNSKLSYYEIGENSSNIMVSSNFCNNTNNISNVHGQKGASPPMELTTSSNSSSDSSAATCEGGGPTTSFPMNSSASHIIQSLFDESQVLEPQSLTHSHQFIEPSNYESLDTSEGEINALINGYNGQVFSGQYSPRTRSNIRASVLNSLQSRSRGPSSLNKKSHYCASKVNSEERFMSKNNSTSNDEPSHKRQRIETPSPLPTFKVRKEKIGDRITALQQLVSPFGRTDTASVLHEAIEYIKFLHDQVNVLSTPYLKSGTPIEQQGFDKLKENDEEDKQDLKSRGLCVVPISSTYPVTQETPVDFWTPTFGRTTFS